MIKPYGLDTNNHSAFKLNYHLILTIKYRQRIITKEIEQRLVEIFEYIAPNHHVTLIESGADEDHIHFLFSTWPNTDLSKFINAYKAASSRLTRKEHPEIKQKLWHGNFWSPSYCLITTGGATLEILQKYIESQGEEQHKNKRAKRDQAKKQARAK